MAATPSRKWATSVMAGAATTCGAWALSQFAHITLPAGIEGAFVVLISGLMSYFIPNADQSTFEERTEP